jgi:hypothetical protein
MLQKTELYFLRLSFTRAFYSRSSPDLSTAPNNDAFCRPAGEMKICVGAGIYCGIVQQFLPGVPLIEDDSRQLLAPHLLDGTCNGKDEPIL